MFLPALEEKLKREQEQKQEKRLYLPDLEAEYQEFLKRKEQEEKPIETVITIQIM